MWVGKVEFTIKFKSFQLTNNFYFNWKTFLIQNGYIYAKRFQDIYVAALQDRLVKFFFSLEGISLTCRCDADKLCGDVCIEIRVHRVLHAFMQIISAFADDNHKLLVFVSGTKF